MNNNRSRYNNVNSTGELAKLTHKPAHCVADCTIT